MTRQEFAERMKRVIELCEQTIETRMHKKGLPDCNIVAERLGIHKTTVYRIWKQHVKSRKEKSIK